MERIKKRIDNKIVYLELSSAYLDDNNIKHIPVWIGKDQRYWGEQVIVSPKLGSRFIKAENERQY